MIHVGNDWDGFLYNEQQKDYYKSLKRFLVREYNNYTVYPPADEIFNAYKLCPRSKIKVVIIGQDCYHGEGQAMGLAFSVNEGIKMPASLRNIYKELGTDLGIQMPKNGDLTRWAKQGVFLLNSLLTVRANEPNSHANHGWEVLTDNTVRLLNMDDNPKVFMLWGRAAKAKRKLIDNPNHYVLEAAHPSPFSAYHGFIGCRHFSKCNQFLEWHNLLPIDWR